VTREDWLRVKHITALALEHPEAEREHFVTDACGDHRELEADVRSLLASTIRAAGLYETAAFDGAPALLSMAARPPALSDGARVGSYRIVREIGRGGMGTVFLAERADDAYRQRVALKVALEVRSPDVLARFREERQILATLEHPNIARLLDGGTTPDGLPFLVMEYVEGAPVDGYAAAHQLAIADRIALFRVVCEAVDYAHRHLIVHRDIKPSNILVQQGVPKLLDFGIAQLLDATAPALDGGLAGPEWQRLTPEYASPEQLKRQPVTTATDVYALGVLLYRLLTHRSPYQLNDDTPQALAQAICEGVPARPSTVAPSARDRRRLEGDLDAIALTALQKDPAARYSSAGRLADDLHRHLTGLPVTARKPTMGYRVGKFLTRHRLGAAAAALVLLSLAGGLTLVLAGARETERQRQRAQQHFDEVRRLASGLVFDISDGIEQLPGSIKTRRLLIGRALGYFDTLAAEERDNVGLQRELAQSYERLGNVLGRSYAANLGEPGAALAAFKKALAVRQRLVELLPGDARAQADVWSSHLSIGNVLRDTADTEGAMALHEAARRALDEQLRAHPDTPELVRVAAQAAAALSVTYVQAGRLDDAIVSANRAVALQQQILDADPANLAQQQDLASGLGRAGQIEMKLGDLVAARGHFERSFQIATGLVAAQPDNPAFRRRFSNTHSHLAQLLLREGDTDAAWRHQEAALALRQSLVSANPADTQASIDLMVSEMETGLVLASRGAWAAAVPHYQAAVARGESLAAADASCVYCRLSLATALTRLASAMMAQARAADGAALASTSSMSGPVSSSRWPTARSARPAGASTSLPHSPVTGAGLVAPSTTTSRASSRRCRPSRHGKRGCGSSDPPVFHPGDAPGV
jgi:tetratricopeptide (TPR) repeat protein